MDIGKYTLCFIFMAVTMAVAEVCETCGEEIDADETEFGRCRDCGCLRPIPNVEPVKNGIAIFKFQYEVINDDNTTTTDVPEDFLPKGFSAEDTFLNIFQDKKGKKYEPRKVDKKFTNLTAAFQETHGAHQQLMLTGNITYSGATYSISALIFDIETGRMVAGITGSSDKSDMEDTIYDIAKALENELPYRGRAPGGKNYFSFPVALPKVTGGRVEIYDSYAYPCGRYYRIKRPDPFGTARTGKKEELSWFDLTEINPRLALTDPSQFKIAPGKNDDPGQMEVLKKGNVEFETGDICYYYPPEIVEKRVSLHFAAAFTTHSYDYAANLKGRENAVSASITFTRRFEWWLGALRRKAPLRYDLGVTVDAPFKYYYEYGETYEGRGRIMGAYVASGNFALDWAFLGTTRRYVPWFGVEAGCFPGLGYGVYEQEGGGYESYENKLWKGFLVGARLELELLELLHFGSRKQWGLTIGVRFYPGFLAKHTSVNYGKHFGNLWRFPGGIRYYF